METSHPQAAAQQGDALLHMPQAEAFVAFRAARAVVVDDNDQPAPLELDAHVDAGRVAVLNRVGRAFLHNAVNGVGLIGL